jgi:hypothetical protein
MAKPDDAVLNLRLSHSLLQQLERATEALETSKSEYVRRSVREALMRDKLLIEAAA